ncbi:MAG TPA: tetratricopeptide repeat protein [Ignavibacteriales bacterium]|nr:tetratricopeptide repeat protein [Ignavibacteriales bacterium]HOL80423.1 tetratricopeptide repeat protein [Ignavibacteriales bacterium]HOM64874.1 tetratricopeptide repeat protein [Ignavibacteriales bacterium]HPD68083.1 tetratricopeptide repeat protein [Ignavibacteriales bacterium]HPP32612.1 tetratricopeptide repeat protein [Ignavibacteriales bacterium]
MHSYTNLVNQAYDSYSKKDFTKAIELINEAEKYLPKDSSIAEGASIYNFRGFCFLSLGEYEKAKEQFEEALNLNPTSPQACVGLGELFYLQNSDKEAKKMYEYALNYDPQNPLAIAGLKKVNKELGLLPEDNSLTSEDNQTQINALVEEAFQLFNKRHFEHALIKVAEAEKLYKVRTTEIENFKGLIYLALNDLIKAKQCFEVALQLNPKSSQACAGLGEIFYLNHQDEEAKKMFEWAVLHNPQNPMAINGLAKVNKSLGKPIYDNTLQGDDVKKKINFEVLFADAYQAFQDKRFKEALERIEEFEKSVKVSSLNFKGFNYLALNDIETAKKCFEQALEIDETSSQACAGLGEIFFLQGDDASAKKMYEYAVAYNPENTFAVEGLAKVNKNLSLPREHNSLVFDEVLSDEKLAKYITDAYEYFDKKEYEKALELLNDFENKAIEISLPSQVSFKNFKGYIYLGMGKIKEARENFETALELDPESSQACAGLGECLYLEGDDEGAKKMFEWSIKHNPANEIAYAGLHKANKNLGLPIMHKSYTD